MDLLYVFFGKFVVRIFEEVIGFMIIINEVEVVDLGMEFGVWVEEGW